MNRQDLTRIMLEGALNGIGFVIGSAIVGSVVSLVLLHFLAIAMLPIIVIVLWFSFKGRRLADVAERVQPSL